jgi:8-amino-7-oxononanoate synthase
MTVPDPLDWLDEKLETLARRGLRRERVARVGQSGPTIAIGGRTLVNYGSNDYLGLAGDARLAEAAMRCTGESGWGSGASPLITGYTIWHERLEARLAEFAGTESAIVFSSGYAANVGTIAALAGRDDLVFSDELNHASIIDGCRFSRAETHVYRHGDADHLETLLRAATGRGRRLIVTDTTFSMDGDLAPLAEITEIADRHGAMLMVDEAHATGVFGANGRGVSEHFGVANRVHVHVGTLSKALGSSGGFVCGSKRLIDWLANRSRSDVFSTSPPAAMCAAAVAALDIVRDEPERRTTLLARAEAVRQRLRTQGWDVGRSASQIIPLVVGDSQRAMQISAVLREHGLFVPGIRPPTVPLGHAMLRISLSYRQTSAMERWQRRRRA